MEDFGVMENVNGMERGDARSLIHNSTRLVEVEIDAPHNSEACKKNQNKQCQQISSFCLISFLGHF